MYTINQVLNLPFERGEILFTKGFFYLYGYCKLQDKAKTSYSVNKVFNSKSNIELLTPTVLAASSLRRRNCWIENLPLEIQRSRSFQEDTKLF